MSHPRQLANHKGVELMNLGKYSEALITLKGGIDQFGNHITSLCDLASCYYLLSDYVNYKKYTHLALTEFEENHQIFSDTTRAEAALCLGKLLEELGHLRTAVKIYKTASAFDFYKSKNASPRLRSQELRCLCTLSLKNEIAEHYIACEQLHSENQITTIENTHALLLADCQLFDLITAKSRLYNIRDKLNPAYERLFVFDFLYECLRQNRSAAFNDELLNNINFHECDPFEKALWDIYLHQNNDSPYLPIELKRSEGMSPFSAAKFLFLVSTLCTDLIDKNVAVIKLQLFLRGFDPSTRSELQQLWVSDESTQTIRLMENCLELNEGKRISIQRQQNLLLILKLFRENQVLDTSKAIKTIFNDEFSEESFNRLRQAITRANKFLATELGFTEPLSLSKTQIKLSNHLKVK